MSCYKFQCEVHDVIFQFLLLPFSIDLENKSFHCTNAKNAHSNVFKFYHECSKKMLAIRWNVKSAIKSQLRRFLTSQSSAVDVWHRQCWKWCNSMINYWFWSSLFRENLNQHAWWVNCPNGSLVNKIYGIILYFQADKSDYGRIHRWFFQ